MTEYPLTVVEIVSWFRSQQSSLEGSGVSVAGIREHNSGAKPSAAADFDGPNTMGRISGWISGEFDFEVLRVSDGKDISRRHADVSALDQLKDMYLEFLRDMKSAPASP